MKTRSKNKLETKKIIEDSSDKEDEPQNIYPKKEENAGWSEQRLTVNYVPQTLIGRQKQREEIYEFVKNSVMNKINSKVLYISGVPGVGKTASTMQIMRKVISQMQDKINFFYINSLSLKNPKDIYKIVYNKLCPNGKQKPKNYDKKNQEKGFYCTQVESFLKETNTNHILVVDEIDFLFTNDQRVFYNLFQWTSSISTKFSLIIIANIMDFPERLNVKVSSRMGHFRLVFSPYTQPEIMQVVEDRLKGCTLFTQRAVMFASKKLAGYSSDIRTILGVLLKAVKQHKREERKGQIDIDAIMKLWSEKFGILVQLEQKLQPLHSKIIQYVKSKGGQCVSKNLYDILSQNGIVQGNFLVLLKELQQMGMVMLKEVSHEGFPYHRIKLAASLLL